MKPDPDTDDVTDGAFGTLTINPEGEAHFIGSFAGSQYLRDDDDTTSSPSTPSDFHAIVNAEAPAPDGTEQPRTRRPAYADGALALHDSFLPGGINGADVDTLRDQLPDWDEEGRDLMESYWEHVNWMYEPVPRTSFENDHWFHAYERSYKPHAHKLACVFLMMAVGSMMDLKRQPWHPRSERLFLLGRACLGLVGLENASPATVQALHLMGTYILNDRLGNGAEVFWPILGSALKVTQSVSGCDGTCLTCHSSGCIGTERTLASPPTRWMSVDRSTGRLSPTIVFRPCVSGGPGSLRAARATPSSPRRAPASRMRTDVSPVEWRP